MELLDKYFKIQKEIYDYFKYTEDWVAIPINDCRRYFWFIKNNCVCFAQSKRELKNQAGNYYEDEIYMQRFLPKWVYTADDFTMICVDTHTDGNKFLSIFDNAKKR